MTKPGSDRGVMQVHPLEHNGSSQTTYKTEPGTATHLPLTSVMSCIYYTVYEVFYLDYVSNKHRDLSSISEFEFFFR